VTDDRDDPLPLPSNVLPFQRRGLSAECRSFYDLFKPENLAKVPPGGAWILEDRALAWACFGDFFPGDEPPWEYPPPKGEDDVRSDPTPC
jgi:hypothetical protein